MVALSAQEGLLCVSCRLHIILLTEAAEDFLPGNTLPDLSSVHCGVEFLKERLTRGRTSQGRGKAGVNVGVFFGQARVGNVVRIAVQKEGDF